jgi:hypothetical protein
MEDAKDIHDGVGCDGCQQRPIIGQRFKCSTCYNYDLCETCHRNQVHSDTKHAFRIMVGRNQIEKRARALIGSKLDEKVMEQLGSAWNPIRVIEKKHFYTSDYIARRLNLYVDDNHILENVDWG